MPLNYSKWDALEVGVKPLVTHIFHLHLLLKVSDDSDIEGHPNVDHKSLVRYCYISPSFHAFNMSLTVIAPSADGNSARFTKNGRPGDTRSPH